MMVGAISLQLRIRMPGVALRDGVTKAPAAMVDGRVLVVSSGLRALFAVGARAVVHRAVVDQLGLGQLADVEVEHRLH
jgi:hypothetical protein